MKYIKTEKYDKNFIKENIMGPNPLKMLEQILDKHPIEKGTTVMDLGCGKGLTSIFLAKECGIRVFATDLWISATENKNRFDDFGLNSDQIIPIHSEAHELPYAEEFFDTIVSIDSYHFFGLEKDYLGKNLLPLVKHGGYLLFVVPGFKKNLHDNLPPEMTLSWDAESLTTIQDMNTWKEIISATEDVEITDMFELEDHDEMWNDWLESDNEYAIGDRKSMNAGAGKHMNFVGIILKRK